MFVKQFDKLKNAIESFDYVGYFYGGLARVKLGNKWSFINTKGKLIGNGKAWFDGVDDSGFHEGFAPVKLNNKWSYINSFHF